MKNAHEREKETSKFKKLEETKRRKWRNGRWEGNTTKQTKGTQKLMKAAMNCPCPAHSELELGCSRKRRVASA